MTRELDELKAQIKELKLIVQGANEDVLKARLRRDFIMLQEARKRLEEFKGTLKVKKEEWYRLYLVECEKHRGNWGFSCTGHTIKNVDLFGILMYFL